MYFWLLVWFCSGLRVCLGGWVVAMLPYRWLRTVCYQNALAQQLGHFKLFKCISSDECVVLSNIGNFHNMRPKQFESHHAWLQVESPYEDHGHSRCVRYCSQVRSPEVLCHDVTIHFSEVVGDGSVPRQVVLLTNVLHVFTSTVFYPVRCTRAPRNSSHSHPVHCWGMAFSSPWTVQWCHLWFVNR